MSVNESCQQLFHINMTHVRHLATVEHVLISIPLCQRLNEHICEYKITLRNWNWKINSVYTFLQFSCSPYMLEYWWCQQREEECQRKLVCKRLF